MENNNKQQQQEETMTPLPVTALYARALISMAFGWIFLRGWQLRDDLFSPPQEHQEMVHFNFLTVRDTDDIPSRKLRANVDTTVRKDNVSYYSACLFITEEDFRLPHWLAYNTFVLPVDYLVVTVGPPTLPHPSNVLELYRKELDMTIIEWTDSDFVDEEQHKTDKDVTESPSGAGQEAQTDRQQLFMEKCAIHMQQHKRQWVTYHDTDEYITFDYSSKHTNVPAIRKESERQGEANDLDEKADIPDWMHAFIDHHGKEKASRLLRSV